MFTVPRTSTNFTAGVELSTPKYPGPVKGAPSVLVAIVVHGPSKSPVACTSSVMSLRTRKWRRIGRNARDLAGSDWKHEEQRASG